MASTTLSASGVFDQHVDADLRHEVDGVFSAAVYLGVAALATEALHLADGEALDHRAPPTPL